MFRKFFICGIFLTIIVGCSSQAKELAKDEYFIPYEAVRQGAVASVPKACFKKKRAAMRLPPNAEVWVKHQGRLKRCPWAAKK